jgi:hypothetical protein
MKKAIEIALRTWYPEDHNLHLNPHHPLGKLLGEWGELLDDYMKSIYKPGYVFEPENELGDIWYYLRILCYQRGYEPVEFSSIDRSIDYLISQAIQEAAIAFDDYLLRKGYSLFALDVCYTILLKILKAHNLTLDQLTASNWQKLKPGSERGEQWMKAR